MRTVFLSPMADFSAYYDQWSKFDVNGELKKVDMEAEKAERIRKRDRKLGIKVRRAEKVERNLGDITAKLGSKLKVMRLKSKRRRGKNPQDSPRSMEDLEESIAFYKVVGDAVKGARAYCLGLNAIEDGHNDTRGHCTSQPNACFDSANDEELQGVIDQLNDSLKRTDSFWKSDLDLIEKETKSKGQLAPNAHEGGCQHGHENEHGHSHSHGHGHSHGHSHCDGGDNHDQNKACESSHEDEDWGETPTIAITSTRSVLNWLRSQLLVYKGKMFVKTGKLHEAVEVLREVLLQDHSNVEGWTHRGVAYLEMGIPHLAILHFRRAVEEDQDCEKAIAALERAEHESRKRAARSRDEQLMWERARSATDPVSTAEAWGRAERVKEEGVVLFLEEFYESAGVKFQVANEIAADAIALPRLSTHESDDRDKNDDVRFMICCNLNLASCYFKCSNEKSVRRALNHYRIAIDLIETHDPEIVSYRMEMINILYRRAQAMQFLCQFKLGLKDLNRAQALLNHVGTAELNKESIGVASEGGGGLELSIREKLRRYEEYVKFRARQTGIE